MTLAVRWVTPELTHAGNVLGYATLCRELRVASEAAGLVIDADAPIALHVMPPIKFAPVAGCRNVIFSMWESTDFPAGLRPRLAEADAVIVPCRWNVGIFESVMPAGVPVRLCPLGVDAETFWPVRRNWQAGERFRFLWLGAPNGRKGPDVVEAAWARRFSREPGLELYMKTTVHEPVRVPDIAAALIEDGWRVEAPDVFVQDNVILDLRHLPLDELVRLYHSAHCFLYPTGGEGFGLTLIEALATACPSIATEYGGHLDFATKDLVTLLPWHPVPGILETDEAYELTSAGVAPDVLAQAMVLMIARYPLHVRRGWQAARAMRWFTWQRAAQRLVRLLSEFTAMWNIPAVAATG